MSKKKIDTNGFVREKENCCSIFTGAAARPRASYFPPNDSITYVTSARTSGNNYLFSYKNERVFFKHIGAVKRAKTLLKIKNK